MQQARGAAAPSENRGTRGVRNVLFIMCDQLRTDHLSTFGGSVPTPNLDALAARGVRFSKAYVSSGVCGPSRVSWYSGRYPASHRVTWNRVPLPLDEKMLGHYLEEAGRSARLLGKTHFVPDRKNLATAGYRLEGRARMLFEEGGFDPVERYDGHFELEHDSPYRKYLIERGYAGERPWTDYVIGSLAADGSIASGWLLRNAALPARVRAEDSETAYLTSRAIDFINAQGDAPWVLHLSYIKPHWPTKAPAPYHAMFAAEDGPHPVRSAAERDNPHPVFAAYQQLEESQTFAQDQAWRTVRPVVLGLVKQIDDEVGRLLAHLEARGQSEETLVVFSSDHGDLAGDHWLGEKEYFYEPVMNVPLIVADPRAAADTTRGRIDERFVETIDMVPTILDALGLDGVLANAAHRLEGRSLVPLLHGATPPWRDCVFGQLDYAYRQARQFLGRAPDECNGWMVRDGRYKYIAWQGYAPQLFDLSEDPHELHDRGADASLAPVRQRMAECLAEWLRTRKTRTSETHAEVEARTHAHERLMGIQIGKW